MAGAALALVLAMAPSGADAASERPLPRCQLPAAAATFESADPAALGFDPAELR